MSADQLLRRRKPVQMADSHLVYIVATPKDRRGIHAFYDVYPAERGSQLGTVERRYATWIARDYFGDEKVADTRWKATTALWGTA